MPYTLYIEWLNRYETWCVYEKGYKDEAEPCPSVLTRTASDDMVLDLVRETFVISNEDVLYVVRGS